MNFFQLIEDELKAWLGSHEEISAYIRGVCAIVAKLQYPTYLNRTNVLEYFIRYEVDSKDRQIVALFETSARSDDAYEVKFPWSYLWTKNFEEIETQRLIEEANEHARIREIENNNLRIQRDAKKEENERRMYERLKLKYEGSENGGQHVVS